MFNIVLFGPPGAGKGTQSKLLIDEYGFHYICPGEILRNEVRKQTKLGKEAQVYIDRGLLAPNELTVAIVEKEIKKLKNKIGFLFDGYPRTSFQASTLDKLLKSSYKSSLSLVIVLNVGKEETHKRIKKRAQILHRTDDQTQDSIAKRMLSYEAITLPVLDYYQKQKKIVRIEGTGGINQVNTRVKNVISMHWSFK